jgi:hypothetical protein
LPDGSGTQTTATVAGLHVERNQFGEVCAVFSVTVHGSFQYWTGAESVTMTQDPPAQLQQTRSSPEGTRLARRTPWTARRVRDGRLVAELNKLLALFSATEW